MLTRRELLAAAAAAPLAGARKKLPIGVQLYSVRTLCQKDLPGTLAGVKKAGYDGVEFAGYYGRTAKELRKLLDDNGLKCCGTHLGLNMLEGAELAKTVEFNQILGNPNLIVASLDEKLTKTRAQWLDHAKKFASIAEAVKKDRMRVGYHNHWIEFAPLDGEMPWDTFFGNTSKDVVMQMDTGNCMHGGGDPVSFLLKYRGRAKTVHVKEFSKTKKGVLIGEGDMKWKPFFDACEQGGATEWYIIEEESGVIEPMESITRSLANLKRLLA